MRRKAGQVSEPLPNTAFKEAEMGLDEDIRDYAAQFFKPEVESEQSESADKKLDPLRELIENRAKAQFGNLGPEEQVDFLTKALGQDQSFALELADAFQWPQPPDDSSRLAAEALRVARQAEGFSAPEIFGNNLNWSEWKLNPNLPMIESKFQGNEELRAKFARERNLRPGRRNLRAVAQAAIDQIKKNG